MHVDGYGQLSGLNNSITGTGSLTLSGGQLQHQRPTNISPLTLTLSGSGNTVINGVIQDFSGGVAPGKGGILTITNTGTTTLNGANTYTGATTVSAGTLLLGSGGSIASGNALTTGSSGTFDLGGHSETFGVVTTAGTITNSGSGTPTLTLGNGSTGTGSFTGAMNLIVIQR